MFTFCFVVAALVACWIAALYCRSDVRLPAPVDDTASTPSADGAVEALPAERTAWSSAGKISERPVLVRGTGSDVAAGEPLRTPAATPTARQLHPSASAQVDADCAISLDRVLYEMRQEAVLRRAFSQLEFTEPDPANPHGIRRPIIEEDE